MEKQNQAEAGSSAGLAMAAMASTVMLRASRLQKASEGVGTERTGGNRDQARLSPSDTRRRCGEQAASMKATWQQASEQVGHVQIFRLAQKYA